MSAQHTPGPRTVVAIDWGETGNARLELKEIRRTGMADARLIAAAPELLEALKEIIAAADGDGWNQLDASFATARAAIAKAEGGAA